MELCETAQSDHPGSHQNRGHEHKKAILQCKVKHPANQTRLLRERGVSR